MKSIPGIAIGMLFISSCSDDPKITDKVDFDRKAMLENWYDNILMPAFTDFNSSAIALDSVVQNFHDNPSLSELAVVKSRFVESYKSFQKIKAFETGPSENLSLRASLNTYPADTDQVWQNVINNVTDLSSAQNIDAKGYPALDFLLYSRPDSFWISTSASQTLDHLKIISNDLRDLSQQNFDDWSVLRSSFVNASGTDVGSSLGQLVNAINKDYELIKNAKIGFPAGKKTLGVTYPSASEAFYSQNLSMELAAINCQAIRNFYKGISYDGSKDGSSIYDYLGELNTTSLGQPLNDLIFDRLREAIDKVNDIPVPFSDAVNNHTDEVDAAYTSIQQNVVLLKTELPSALGVLITYQDNDGD